MKNEGRIAKWIVELREFDIRYALHTTVKSQVLANFFTDWTDPETKEEEDEFTNQLWTFSFDGSLTLS